MTSIMFLLSDLHLPEDLEVRGFVGLKTALSKLDFMSGIGSGVPDNMEHSCRCYRLVKWRLKKGLQLFQAL